MEKEQEIDLTLSWWKEKENIEEEMETFGGNEISTRVLTYLSATLIENCDL